MAIENLEKNPFVNPAINNTENEKGIPSPSDQFVKLSLQSRLAISQVLAMVIAKFIRTI